MIDSERSKELDGMYCNVCVMFLCSKCLNKQMDKDENCKVSQFSKEVQGEYYEEEGGSQLFDNAYCPKCRYMFLGKNITLSEKNILYWAGKKHRILFELQQ